MPRRNAGEEARRGRGEQEARRGPAARNEGGRGGRCKAASAVSGAVGDSDGAADGRCIGRRERRPWQACAGAGRTRAKSSAAACAMISGAHYQ